MTNGIVTYFILLSSLNLTCIGVIIITRRKTHEEFVQQVYGIVGDEYTVNGIYYTNETPIEMIHNTCGNQYEVQPKTFILGYNRCKECKKKRNKYS